MAKKQVFEYFFNRLVNGYRSVMGKNPEGLDLIKIKQEARQKLIDQNKVIEFPQKRSFGEEVDQMIAKGEVNVGTADKTPPYKPSKSQTDFEIQERYRTDNEKAIKRFEEKMKKDKPDDMATGGRAGYYGGGQAMVGEDLSEIGHGSDSLMARNMQLAPGGQATTSTGLNYLLGQDNDTARVPYSKGKLVKEVADKGRRGFMKAAGAGAAGIAALKTGLLGFGEKVAPVAKETVEAATSAIQGVPPYFFKLVEKIKNFGVDTPKLAVKDREKITTYKDYTLTEDVTTGEKTIQRQRPSDSDYYDGMFNEEVYMSYRPGKGQIDETTGGKNIPDEYTEDTSYIRSTGSEAGDIFNTVDGIPDTVLEEAGEKIIEKKIKSSPLDKASGGRIGFGKGDIVTKGIPALIKAGEGKFTKAQYLIERIKNTIKGNPDDKYVQETFPNFIKELEANPDLAKNENVFKELGGDLPDNQQIVVYGDDTLDFFTTSSGPKNIKKLENFMAKHNLPKDQALRIMKMEPNDQVMELTKTKFIKQKRTDNADGGRIGLFLGGGLKAGKALTKEMLKFMSKDSANAKSPAGILKMMNPKQFEKLLDNPKYTGKISPATGETADQMILDMIKKTKEDRSNMVGDLIGSARKIKKVDDDIIAYKQKIIKDMIAKGIDENEARGFADLMAKEIKKTAAPQLTSSPPKVTEQGLLELENIQKNLLTRDRQLQASGGLATMLGE